MYSSKVTTIFEVGIKLALGSYSRVELEDARGGALASSEECTKRFHRGLN